MGENTERFFLQQWCEQTTESITRIQEDVTAIKVSQQAHSGRLKALEKTERTAKWAIRGAAVAAFTVFVEFVKYHMGR